MCLTWQDFFFSGPLLALALAREDAVTSWREKLGPKEIAKAKEEAPDSLRAQFSLDESPINQLHGSDTTEAAESELNFFFPMQQTMAMIKPDGYQTKGDNSHSSVSLTPFLSFSKTQQMG